MKYEYVLVFVTMSSTSITQDSFCVMGADGWRLIQIVDNMAVFERPIDTKKKK